MANISIIVPIFNAEFTIRRCIESVRNQFIADWELILVDDGSMDNSYLICQEYTQSDNRIKCIHIENSGVSVARNLGIEMATSTWVSFLDSDDYYGPDWLSWMNNENIDDYDLIIQGFTVVEDGKQSIYNLIMSEIGTDIMENYLIQLEKYNYSPLRMPWNKFYKREIIVANKIKFLEGLHIGEDFVFNMHYLAYVRKIFQYSTSDYFYIVRNNGLARKSHPIEAYLQLSEKLVQAALDNQYLRERLANILAVKYYSILLSMVLADNVNCNVRQIEDIMQLPGFKKYMLKSKYFLFALQKPSVFIKMYRFNFEYLRIMQGVRNPLHNLKKTA